MGPHANTEPPCRGRGATYAATFTPNEALASLAPRVGSAEAAAEALRGLQRAALLSVAAGPRDADAARPGAAGAAPLLLRLVADAPRPRLGEPLNAHFAWPAAARPAPQVGAASPGARACCPRRLPASRGGTGAAGGALGRAPAAAPPPLRTRGPGRLGEEQGLTDTSFGSNLVSVFFSIARPWRCRPRHELRVRVPRQVAEELRQRVLALYDRHLAPDGRAVDYAALGADPGFAAFCAAAAELQARRAAARRLRPPACSGAPGASARPARASGRAPAPASRSAARGVRGAGQGARSRRASCTRAACTAGGALNPTLPCPARTARARQAVDMAGLSREARMALYINIYNQLIVRAAPACSRRARCRQRCRLLLCLPRRRPLQPAQHRRGRRRCTRWSCSGRPTARSSACSGARSAARARKLRPAPRSWPTFVQARSRPALMAWRARPGLGA